MDIHKLSFYDKKFDCIFMLEVLEHVQNPFQAIKEISRILEKDGHVILSTPFCFGVHDIPYDYYRFTKYGLTKIFSENFDEIFVKKRTGFTWTILVLFSRLIISKNYVHKFLGIILTILGFLFSPLAYLLDKTLPDDITTGYVAVFRKKN